MRLALLRAVLFASWALACGGRAEDSSSEGGDGDLLAGSGGRTSGTDGSSGGEAGDGDTTSSSGGNVVEPDEVGHVAKSCGAFLPSLDEESFLDCSVGGDHEFHPECDLVDCTAYGDIRATCVFSNHCFCNEGFTCEGGQTWMGAECHPRASCVPEL